MPADVCSAVLGCAVYRLHGLPVARDCASPGSHSASAGDSSRTGSGCRRPVVLWSTVAGESRPSRRARPVHARPADLLVQYMPEQQLRDVSIAGDTSASHEYRIEPCQRHQWLVYLCRKQPAGKPNQERGRHPISHRAVTGSAAATRRMKT
eukprot:353565-Chlamydomonas_euryale.AAC.3